PPYVDFYRAALGGLERASRGLFSRSYAELAEAEQRDFVTRLRQNKLESWQGPSQASVYGILRNDAIDVVYGTVEGFARLGVPYMPHIRPGRGGGHGREGGRGHRRRRRGGRGLRRCAHARGQAGGAVGAGAGLAALRSHQLRHLGAAAARQRTANLVRGPPC